LPGHNYRSADLVQVLDGERVRARVREGHQSAATMGTRRAVGIRLAAGNLDATMVVLALGGWGWGAPPVP
jgi:hypothetical protein